VSQYLTDDCLTKYIVVLYVGGFTLRERQNSRVRVEITAVDEGGERRRLACKLDHLSY
jgi:hypothetical protein